MAIENNARFNLGKIGVLMGGPSTERDISLKSGKAVYEALKQLNVDVVAIDVQSDDIDENAQLLISHKINCAFIALHGRFGEDGQVQEVLDDLNIPYTGSGSLASSLAIDKIASRKILEVAGVAVPRYKVLDKNSYRQDWKFNENFTFPVVVKPATHGSSIGLSIVDDEKKLSKAIDLAFTFDKRIIIEEYVSGREVTVGILEGVILPVIEIIPKNRFFDYEAKYQAGMTDYIVPAKLEEEVAKRAQATASQVHKLLGCDGFSRVDMILSAGNIPFVLELNSVPGLTPTSLLPKAALVAGIEFQQLCLKLINLAYEKK